MSSLLMVDYSELNTWLQGAGFPLDEKQISVIENFKTDLYAYNKNANLTRIAEEDFLLRHFLDSVLFADLFLSGSSVLDVGTGPGFPAWPLAILRPDLMITALDSSGKMLKFLHRHPLPNLSIVEARAEDWDISEEFDFVTGRAVAPLSLQLELSARPCKRGGKIIPMRSLADRETIENFPCAILGLRLVKIEERVLPELDAIRLFPIFEKINSTPAIYPRRWADMRKSPI